MPDIKTNTKHPKIPWGKAIDLIKDYFVKSDEKLVAWLLLIGTTLCIISLVALMASLTWWSAGFWIIVIAKDIPLLLASVGQLTLIISAYVGIATLKNFFMGKLSILWRNWLTHKISNQLFSDENNYLDLKRTSTEIDNISQRIQEDIKNFVDLTLTLGADFLKSVLSLGTFISTLWIVGGALTFVVLGLNIVIPGYMVWVSITIAIASTLTTHFIAKSLTKKNQQAECAEADFRKDLETLNNDAENIAEEHAENYYKKTLKNKIQEINNNANQKLKTQSKLAAFQNFYMQVSGVLPDLLSAPLYFAGLIELGQLIQIGLAFGEVNSSLKWFVEAYDNVAKYKTSLERVAELQKVLDTGCASTNPKSIVRKEKAKRYLKIKGLNIMQPITSSAQYIMRNLNLKFTPGEHTLIKGPSGLGKSTFFKVISGAWKYGDGKIVVPSGKMMYFLPQKPTLPYSTLMAVLAYPEEVETYTEEQYISALEAVGAMNEFLAKLQEKRDWSKELSGGQQQRISFARALLKKPDWLFLDEATAALDEESERQVYTAITQLKNTTVVSIAHRKTVEKYHSRVVFFSTNEEKEIEIIEKSHELLVRMAH